MSSYKYVIIDTSHHSLTDTTPDVSSFTCVLNQHPLRNVKRVAVAYATIKNDHLNVDSEQKTDNFTIAVKFPSVSPFFQNLKFTLDSKYYSIDTLLTEMNNKIKTNSDFADNGNFDNEVFKFNTLTGRVYVDLNRRIGKTADAVLKLVIDGSSFLFQELGFAIPQKDEEITTINANIIQAVSTPTIENFGNYYIHSPDLGQDCMITTTNNKEVSPSDILCYIPNTVARNYFLNFEALTLWWHNLNKQVLPSFTVELRNHNRQKFSIGSLSSIKIALVFEVAEINQRIEQTTADYHALGYARGHPLP